MKQNSSTCIGIKAASKMNIMTIVFVTKTHFVHQNALWSLF